MPIDYRPIDFAPGYVVSSDGRVIDCRRDEPRWRWLKQCRVNGYPMVTLVVGGAKKGCYVHRLVASAFVPNPDGKPEVIHKDGDRTNAQASNLSWGTRADRGRRIRILHESEQKEIVARIAAGESQNRLAREFDVAQSVVHRIRKTVSLA
jgi:hypothetical protein